MTVKELVISLLNDFELDQVVEFTDIDLGWSNLTTAGDRFNPKIVPDIPIKHQTEEWKEWLRKNKQ